jgi:cbb3-type cytochrome oxidase maturation protein
MEILYLLIPLALILVAVIVWVFMWAIRSGQFDDMEGPAHSILMDDDEPVKKPGLPEDNPETHKSQRRE